MLAKMLGLKKGLFMKTHVGGEWNEALFVIV